MDEKNKEKLFCKKPVDEFDYSLQLGDPGQYPYTRGIHPRMYAERLWTMRQFSGFGSAEDTNKRFRYLLEHGETGFSTAFDMPTLFGKDSDNLVYGKETGLCGVAIDTLADMEILFNEIDLNPPISTSMTINAPAIILFAMYLAVAEKKGVDWKNLRGTIQNDILKEYIAQKEWIFPPEPSMRLITDIIEFCVKYVPQWYPISISGYHIREAGSTAAQELGFTLRDGIEYVEWAIRAGLKVDDFAPRLSFFFDSCENFFEEISKFRAARRMWARIMKERFHSENDKSRQLRFHTQTSGLSLQAVEPENNVIRTTLQALAAVLGGTQSLHTNSRDETLCLPTEEAVKIALRTQQIIAYESGIINAVDPLGGSYHIEDLTNKLEAEAMEYIKKIDEMGGMIEAIEQGYPQREIRRSAFERAKKTAMAEKVVVGVNKFPTKEKLIIPVLKIDPEIHIKQVKRLNEIKQERDNFKVKQCLENISCAAASKDNLVFPVIEAVRNYATIGEICMAFEKVCGRYEEKV
ncbi:MAG: methylmalonyl-CoA mutase [Parcubacteria group bacterium GW2011_GWA2_38_13b]|nr:MAG: methylmalonyl-CoA mutase [Parcubacteria group bacterium GW2011_GWA2_38_13b]